MAAADDPRTCAVRARRACSVRAGPTPGDRSAQARGRARRARDAARSWRHRAAGDPHPVADQPAEHPRSRSRGVAGVGDCADGPSRAAARLGRSARPLRAQRVRPHRAIAAPAPAIGCRSGRAGRLLPWRDDGHRSRQFRSRRTAGDACGAVAFRRLFGEARDNLGAMWRDTRSTGGGAWRAADGGVAGRLLVARPERERSQSSPCSAASIRRAPKPGASSSSKIGPMRASRCPTPPPANCSRISSPPTCPARAPGRSAGKPSKYRCSLPLLHVTAAHDRITPAAAAPPGDAVELATGHVGMIVGSARERLHDELAALSRPRLPLGAPEGKRAPTHP